MVGGPHEELVDDKPTADPGAPEEPEFPEVDFETLNGDYNSQAAFGGRVAYAFLPQVEIGYSFYGGAYDAAAQLDYNASAILKLSYQDTKLDNGETDSRVLAQLAFGF